MKLLVGTIFAKDDEIQRQWLELQLSYLRATTEDFDHLVYLYGKPSVWFEEHTKVIQATDRYPIVTSLPHIEGLKKLLTYFKSYSHNYDYFLFIDSDAFPIRKNWVNTLIEAMENRHKIAVVLRSENLETRWHSSILFARKEALKDLRFDFLELADLKGDFEKDVSILGFQDEDKASVFPLLRSNRYNIHPLLCGIYYDMFYHHSCGSGRKYNLRGRDYWSIIANKELDVSEYTKCLMKDKESFINKLAGWDTNNYAKLKGEDEKNSDV